MKKEDITDEVVNEFRKYLKTIDVSNCKPATRDQFEDMKHKLNNCKTGVIREMSRRLGIPLLGDLSYGEYVATSPPMAFDDGNIGYDNLSTAIDDSKAFLKGKPCILCENKKTKANLIDLDDSKLCLPLCNKCFKRDDEIKAWTEGYKILCDLHMESTIAQELLEKMLKTLPKLRAAMSKEIGFEADELAVCGFKKVEPDDAPLKKLASDSSTKRSLQMLQIFMGLLQQVKP